MTTFLSGRAAVRSAARFFAVALLAISTQAFPKAFPDKDRPVRIVVPFGVGSGSDTVMRAYARAVNEQTGINVIVENKAGAEGSIGTEFVKNAAPDGYTVLFGNLSTHILNVYMLPKLSYDPVADFIPVTGISNVALVLNAGPSTKIRTIGELIEAARAEPGKLTFASGTTSTRLSVEMFQQMAHIKMLSVPYKTQSQAAVGLAGGEVDFLVTDVSTALPYFKNGRLRPLGTTGRTRLAALPDVPTISEQGVENYEFSAWHALFVPTGTPPDVVGELARIFRDAARSQYVADALKANSCEGLDMDTEQLKARIRADLDGWGTRLRAMK